MSAIATQVVPVQNNNKPNDLPTPVVEPVEQSYAGMKVMVEHPAGSTRTGIGQNGKPWSTNMLNSYGFIKNGKGADGEGLDCYLGPKEDAKEVHVIHQNKPDGTFDEDKAMIGFDSADAAKTAYQAHAPPDLYRSHTSMPTDTFKSMITKAEPGSAHWKKKMGRNHATQALLSADPNLLITTYGVDTPETMNTVVELARASLAKCPACGSYAIKRKPGAKSEGPKDKCGFCGKIFSPKPGSLTTEQHEAKQNEMLARQTESPSSPYPNQGTTEQAGFAEDDPPVEGNDDEKDPDSDDDDQEGQTNSGDVGDEDVDLSKIPGLKGLLSRAAQKNFKLA